MANNMTDKNQYKPNRVTHPGTTLEAKIKEMDMSIREFAIRTAKPEKTILAVIKGDSSITPDMAVIFENVTLIPAHFWLARQRNYDEFQAHQRLKQKIEASAGWVDCFPIRQMEEYGWINSSMDLATKTKSLLQFFSLTSKEAWENYYINQQLKIAFRISLKSSINPFAISAWLRQGDRLAGNIEVTHRYSHKRLKEKLDEMKAILTERGDDWAENLQAACADCGIKLIFTPVLPEAPINGAARWIASKYPCIQMLMEEECSDNFKFTFFHEIGHILLHGKKDFFLENVEYENKESKKEREADSFARSMLDQPA